MIFAGFSDSFALYPLSTISGHYEASIIASATPRLPPDHATALQHWRQGACEDSDVLLRGHEMAETVSEAHDFFPRFSQEKCAAMVHAPGLLHIGGAAYFVWAYPPNFR